MGMRDKAAVIDFALSPSRNTRLAMAARLGGGVGAFLRTFIRAVPC